MRSEHGSRRQSLDMSTTNGKRLDASVFRIDPRMRGGRYSDQYFLNARAILSTLAAERYRFTARCAELSEKGFDVSNVDVGNIETEMQCFTKREPFSVACGVDQAIAILKSCTGFTDDTGAFHDTAAQLEVDAVQDGARLLPWKPALRIRGRYRDFAILETPMLGVLARGTRIATNTYELLKAAGGKPVFFFPARFDLPETQSADGYAYHIGVQRYNMDEGRQLPVMITTEAQGEWWGGKGGGTVSHSFVLAFLGDCPEAMLHFSRVLPVDVKRVALVDTKNDCVGESLRTAVAMFSRYYQLRCEGKPDEAEKYVLFGVRCDTAREIRDVSVEETGEPEHDCGVVPSLVTKLRAALDRLHETSDLLKGAREQAGRYFRAVKIVVSGGFDCKRIARFEELGVPVDMYGVGSSFLTAGVNDYTADVVRVKVGGRWVHMAKVGRRAIGNPDLERVPMAQAGR